MSSPVLHKLRTRKPISYCETRKRQKRKKIQLEESANQDQLANLEEATVESLAVSKELSKDPPPQPSSTSTTANEDQLANSEEVAVESLAVSKDLPPQLSSSTKANKGQKKRSDDSNQKTSTRDNVAKTKTRNKATRDPPQPSSASTTANEDQLANLEEATVESLAVSKELSKDPTPQISTSSTKANEVTNDMLKKLQRRVLKLERQLTKNKSCKSFPVRLTNKSNETRIFSLYLVRDGEILNAPPLLADMKTKMLQTTESASGYLKCGCSSCIQDKLQTFGRSNTLLEHMRKMMKILIQCPYCEKRLKSDQCSRMHLKTFHWKLGDLPMITNKENFIDE